MKFGFYDLFVSYERDIPLVGKWKMTFFLDQWLSLEEV